MTVDMAATLRRSSPVRSREPLSPALARSLMRIGARSRIEGELRAIAIDLLGPYGSDELPAECAAWVHTTIETAVSGVGDSSLASLANALDTLLATAPPDVARRLDEARIRHDAGFF